MESIVLQPLLQVVFEKLGTLVYANLSALVSFKKDHKRLEDQLLLIQGVIQDAEERQVLDERIRAWLSKLQSVVYDADDLLDRIDAEDHRKQTSRIKVPFISHLLPSFDSLNISLELKDIQATIGGLVSEIPLLSLRYDVRFRRYETFERPQTGIFVNESEVVGRREDEQAIVNKLLSLSSVSVSRSIIVPVLPIVGMGGIGKTTLAQLVYKNPRIEKHFDLRMWIAVGGSFNVRKLIRDILEYAGCKNAYGSHLPQLGLLQSRLQESLSGRKYLLVLDDVWNEDEAEWSKLIEPLSCGVGGSKIVVTTRNQAVAMLTGTYASFYALKPLACDACWTLFHQRVFPNGGEDAYPILADIGRDIVKKCGGIPLAAKVLGSLLRSNRDEREWLNVLRSEVWDLRDNTILSVLRLTYNHLPPNQKRCFSYCSVFPKKYEINREKLIHQWIAEGLIPSAGDMISNKKMEDIANEYFNDLVSMSLFEGVSYSEDGRIADFRLHNLIHDLALSVYKPVVEKSSHEELFICRAERRAYIVCSELSPAISKRLSIEKLRTLQLITRGNDFTKVVRSLFKSHIHLRVLNLSNCGITTLHKSVGSLIYLRYLDLSNNPIHRLPETICLLRKLQSLNLSSCRALEVLPIGITNLNLRHLNIEDCVSLSWIPPNIGALTNLKTLPIFILGLNRGNSLHQLEHLDLRGKLKIKHLENAGNFLPDLCLEYKQLHTLSLSWGDDNEGKVDRNAQRQNVQGNHGHDQEKVLHCLAPNRYLRVLEINEYPGNKFPRRINKLNLPNLTKLVLVNCRRCETLPTLGQLQFLTYLQMEGMDDVVKISNEFYGGEGKTKPFPCLDELILKVFPNLRSWESMDSLEVFPCLRKLSVLKCPRLINMPWFPSLRHLELLEFNDMILRSVTELNLLSTLVIDVCPEAHFIPRALLSNNSNLTSLKISSWPRLSSLPATIGSLAALESLSICFCEALENFPTEILSLASLETLEIIQCPGLISLPDESMRGLKSLRSLSIENCFSLDSLPLTLGDLTALEHLTIMYCPNLVYIPDVMQEFRALRSLNIVNCTGLESLPSGLENASSLHNLEIRGCPKLQELPDWIGNLVSLRSLAISDCENIKFLPDGLQRLQELQHLSITDCPDLEVRCRKDTGEDWHKISYIPFKYVGTLQHGEPSASSSSS